MNPTRPTKTAYLSFIGPVSEQNVETLVARCNVEMERGATTIHLMLTSYGGGVAPGVAAYALLKGLPVELITHNSGNVGSIANMIFLAGKRRYAHQTATFWFHGTTASRQNANAADMHSAIDGIHNDNERTVTVLVKETGMSEADAKALLSSVGVTKTAADALACGIVHEVREVVIPPGAPFFQLILNHAQ